MTKTVKEILESYNDNYLSKEDPRFGKKFPPEKEIPNVINLRRKAIRIFPDGQKIALYYSPQLDKYVSIPYGPGTQASGIQISEAHKPYDYDPDVPDEFKNIYDTRKKKVSRKDTIGKMSSGQLGHFTRTGQLKGREAAAEVIKRYKPGSGLHTLGNLIGLGLQKTAGAVGRRLPEETFKSKLQQIREARQYGAADAALDAASFVPGPAGSAASLASAGMSLSRGDYIGAALDTLGALPVVGYGAKALKAVKVARAISKTKKSSKLKKLGAGLAGYSIASELSKPDSDGENQPDSQVSSYSKPRKKSSEPRVVGRTYKVDEEQLRKEENELIEEILSALPSNIREEYSQKLINENYTEVGQTLEHLVSMLDEGILNWAKRKLNRAYVKAKAWLKGKGGAGGAAAGGAAAGYLAGKGIGDQGSSWDVAKRAVPKPDSETQFSDPGHYLKTPRSGGGQGSGQDFLQRQKELGMGYKPMAVRETTNFNKIQAIVENNIKTEELDFDGNLIKINNRIAKKVINLYESLNKDNKEKIKNMINEDITSFKKVINFAIRQ